MFELTRVPLLLHDLTVLMIWILSVSQYPGEPTFSELYHLTYMIMACR